MRPFIEVGVIIAALGSAMFWFRSAMCRLPSVKPSTDEVKVPSRNYPKRCKE